MQNLLVIKSSLMQQDSISSGLADYYCDLSKQQNLDVSQQELNLNSTALPVLDAETVAAMYAEQPNENQRVKLAASDELIEQLFSVDTLLLAVPMYNFAIPSKLKNYFDLVARVGKTFNYGDQGPEGKLNHLKVIVIVSSGGDYTQPPYDQFDQVTPYLKTILGFVGVQEIEFVYAPNMAQQGETKQQSLERARQQLADLITTLQNK